MEQELKNELIKLLNGCSGLVVENDESPHDFPSLRQHMMLLELKQEIAAIRKMLATDALHFEALFKARCLMRETEQDTTIPFSAMPLSPSHQLYTKIIHLIFKPKNLMELVNILLPSVQTVIEVDLCPSKEPRRFGHRKTEDVLEPVLVNINVADALSELPAHAKLLRNYVLHGKALFAVTSIVNFPLTIHAKLQNLLAEKHPEIAAQLKKHNQSLQALTEDIQTLNQGGTTPKLAIQRLINSLTMGGSMITGVHYASEAATKAMKRFILYILGLPEKTRTELRALKCGKLSFGNVFDDEIERGKCVETLSTHLQRIVDANRTSPVLNCLPAMSPADIQLLKGKYRLDPEGKSILNTQKDSSLQCITPNQLIKRAIRDIKPTNTEDFLLLLINFPIEFYELLWEAIVLENPFTYFKDLARFIALDLFNTEQKKALFSAISKHYLRFNFKYPILIWALTTNDKELIKDAWQAAPENQRQHLCTDSNEIGKTLLHEVAHLSHSITFVLERLPQDQRFPALVKKNLLGKAPWAAAIAYPDAVRAILVMFPSPQQQKKLVLQVNEFDDAIITLAADKPRSIAVFFEILPEKLKLSLLFVRQTTTKQSVFQKLANASTPIAEYETLFINKDVPQLIAVHRMLKKYDHTGNVICCFFKLLTPAEKLRRDMEKCNSLMEIKHCILKFVAANPKQPLSTNILSLLEIEPQAELDCNLDETPLLNWS